MKQPTLPAVAMAALSLGATLGLAAPQPTPPFALNTTTPVPERAQPTAAAADARKPLGHPGSGGDDVMSIMGDKPVMPHDPNTNPECTWWYDNDGALSCFDVLSIFGISAGDFAYWNPSVSSSCSGMKVGFSYCVEAPAGSPTSTTSTTSTTTTSSGPTTTKPPGNGIETPRPVQEGMVGNCNKFYFVPSGESCSDVLRKNGLSISQLFSWNSAVKADCTGMWAEVYVCVGVIGGTPVTTPGPTTTKPGNGISTPTPVQEGMIGNCNKFYFVPSGESCSDVLRKNGLTISQLFAWNSAVKSDCTGMWAEVYVCVGVVGGGGSPVTTPGPTTTKPGNGITTPTPTQPGMVGNCDKFYLVPSGQSCSALLSEHGITLAQFFAWNAGVKSDCSGMWANVYACVSVIGHEPPTTTRGNGVATPTPTQSGMVSNCKSFHKVASGQNCESIAKQYRITVANFIRWNPAAKSDCTGLWANTYACVGLL